MLESANSTDVPANPSNLVVLIHIPNSDNQREM
jgi:hypothetical protein